ncbi:MAG: tetratricopeptide repeat protein [Pseudomonadota bacterium]
MGTVAVAITTVSAFAITQHQVAAANLRSVEDAEAVTAFTDDSFANLNPKFRGKDILLIEVIDAVDERLAEGGVQLRPTAEASLRDSIGWTYFQLGAYKEADPHLTLASQIRRKSVGYESPQFALSYYKQTLNDWYLGRTAGLTEKLEEIIDLQRRVLGAKSILLAITLKDLSWKYVLDQRYGPAEELAESAIAVFQEAGAVDPPSREYIEMVNNYGVLKQAVAEQARLDGDLQTARANFSEAETYLRNAIDMHIGTFGEDSAGLGSSYNNLANLYSSLWRNDEAIDLHRKNVDLASRVLGDDHYSTILGRSNLAGVLNIECRYKEAKEMYESALPGWDAVGGEDQPFALDTQEGIINVYFQLGDHRKAATELENLYEIRRRVNGDAADETLNTLDFLVAAQSWADNHQRSVDLINQHYERLFDMHGGADLATSRARWIWADYYFAQTEYETVRDAIEEQIKHLSKAESDSDNKWAEAIDEWRIFLARVDIRERKYEDAAARLEAVLEHNDDRYGKYNERSLDAIGWLALTRWRLGEKDASIATWQDRLDRVREKWGNNAPDVWSNRERLSRLYLRTGQVERGRETFAPFLERDSHPCDPEGLRETQLDLVSKLFDEGDYEASARVAQHAFRQEDNDVGVPTQTALDALDWAVKSLIEQGSWDKADNLARTWRDRLERRSELEGTPMPESADVALQTIAERRL